ncbi:MAG: hypothetical protein K6F86_05195 [Lachnospiraceae bacterium]|nr:hypothetical protein [Lachnospiraceae bacterium]
MADKTNQAQAYNCISCGAPLHFDPATGKLKCDYCDSLYTPEEIEEHFKNKESEEAAERTDEEFKSYSCSSCGAELLADQNTAVILCPYCGNNTIATAQFASNIRPDCLIPFAVEKKQAMQKYESYYQDGMIKKFLLPKSFKTNSHIQDIQGVYVPFWLFSGNADIDGTYEASNDRREGDYIIHDIYQARRSGSINFKDVPADASKRMPDDLMDSIEPYQLGDLKDFSMAYLPGFLAERFDVDEAEDKKRAEDRVEGTIRERVNETLRYDTIRSRNEKIDVTVDKTKYALLPAWVLTTRWNNTEWMFAMNAQTGKFTGNLPINKGKYWATVILSFFIILILGALLFGDAGTGAIIGIVVAIILAIVMHGTMKPVAKAANANVYAGDKLELAVKEDTFLRKEKEHSPQNKS